MKTKILGIFICMLPITAIVPTITSFQYNHINITVPDAPWESFIGNWTETYKITAGDGTAEDYFGYAVSLHSDTALIGAWNDDDIGNMAGSVYVFHRTGATWTQQAKLFASDGEAGDRFGFSVSLYEDIALIGAVGDDGYRGSAYVFTRTSNTWTEQAKLIAYDGAAADQFGCAVSLYGSTALIGADMDDDLGTSSGSAHVFTWDGSSWVHVQKLYSSPGETFFGCSVSLSNDTALIGANSENMKGAAYVFIRPGVDWILQQKLVASDGEAYDCFGNSVSLDEDTALIGAAWDDDNGDASGSAYIFTRTGGSWTQQQKLLASDGAAFDIFGRTIALSGDAALIPSYGDDDNGEASGSVYLFTWDGTSWTEQQKLLASDGVAGDEFGVSVSLEGDTALIGADRDDDNNLDSGSVYVFSKDAGIPGLKFDITGGIGVNLKITNNGSTQATAIEWQLHVEGGIFGHINTTINDTVDIPVGESRTVGTGLFFGLGPISIVAQVADEEKIAEGLYLFIYSTIKK